MGRLREDGASPAEVVLEHTSGAAQAVQRASLRQDAKILVMPIGGAI
ncbi:hypothetical protein [Paractinoplanes brasiliensis]|nr:hypothetical protein [Actinoplanes brasiliensis]